MRPMGRRTTSSRATWRTRSRDAWCTMPQEPPVLRVEHLTVRFCRRRIDLAAVNGVSFALARGETLTILGESGSGKSVSLKALMGLPPAYAEIEGCIRLDGKDILDMPPG